jgi:hypothetical protein
MVTIGNLTSAAASNLEAFIGSLPMAASSPFIVAKRSS